MSEQESEEGETKPYERIDPDEHTKLRDFTNE
jgi:hypothetical protein